NDLPPGWTPLGRAPLWLRHRRRPHTGALRPPPECVEAHSNASGARERKEPVTRVRSLPPKANQLPISPVEMSLLGFLDWTCELSPAPEQIAIQVLQVLAVVSAPECFRILTASKRQQGCAVCRKRLRASCVVRKLQLRSMAAQGLQLHGHLLRDVDNARRLKRGPDFIGDDVYRKLHALECFHH